MHPNIDALLTACAALRVQVEVRDECTTQPFKAAVYAQFLPDILGPHPSIGKGSILAPTDDHEFRFTKKMLKVPCVIFFDDVPASLQVADLSRVSDAMALCHGMEYFISNPSMSFLISVNWYQIELDGEAQVWI